MQLSLQRIRQRQRRHAAGHEHLEVLIRPVLLRAQGDALGPLHLVERAFEMVLGGPSAHDFRVDPVVVVGELEGLAGQVVCTSC